MKHRRFLLRFIPLIILNCGWLIPAYYAFQFLMQHLSLTSKKPHELHSFPYLHFANQLAGIAALWLFLAIAWATFQQTKKALPSES